MARSHFLVDRVIFYSDVAVVSLQAHITGEFAGDVAVNNFRFTRVWSKTSSDVWQKIAGHSSIVT
ncbi:MAG: DUF4440 domain-containing protein [Acidiferrobacterales bacterium]